MGDSPTSIGWHHQWTGQATTGIVVVGENCQRWHSNAHRPEKSEITMRNYLKYGLPAVAAVATALLFASCGDNITDTPSGSATTIDLSGATTGIAQLSPLIPVCNATAGAAMQLIGDQFKRRPSLTERVNRLRLEKKLLPAAPALALTGTKPADQLGDCGGRITYPVYSHLNGVTTGTYAFENYCSLDDDTGDRSTANGQVTFVWTATTTSSGPITNKVEASSSAGVTFVTQTSTGSTISSQKYLFTNYLYTAGVPGGTPTSSNPDRLQLDELKVTDQITNKTYRQTNYVMTTYETTSGGDVVSITGRGYRSNGEFFEILTDSPLTTDFEGNTISGAFRFTGANGTNAVMTLVPGSILQATMTVNGTVVTGLPACRVE